ncbi:MAG: retropepsin-like aspartic protease [Verrucomicrobiota bacterium]
MAAQTSEPPTDWKTANINALMKLLQNRNYLEFEQAFKAHPDFSPLARDFFAGVLANRQNDVIQSAQLLEPMLTPLPPGQLPAEQRKLGLLTLADDYVKSFQYGKAAEAYAHVLQQFASLLGEQEKKEDIADCHQICELMKDYPAQTIKTGGPFTVQTKRDAIGLIEVPIEVGGKTGLAVIDTGADITTISLTRAHQLGLKISEGTTLVGGAAGAKFRCHTALIPLLKIGNAEIHNLAAIVMDDKDLYVAEAHFQIEVVIGYPVVAALGCVTFYADGRIDANQSTNKQGAEMFMEGNKPWIAAKTRKGVRLFFLDTGAPRTTMYDLYWNENRDVFAGANLGTIQFLGAGGNRDIPGFLAAEVPLVFGTIPVVLHNIAVLTKPHTDAPEVLYGCLGQDLLRPLRSWSLDFRSMRFQIEAN